MSRSLRSMLSNSDLIFFSNLEAITFSWRSCCNISLEIFSDKSCESTRPFTKLK